VRSLRDLELRRRRVFLRADLNVPLDQGRISDGTRIEATLPSLRFVLERGGRLVVASHLGRPEGERRPELSLTPVAEALSGALHLPVELAPDCVGETTERLVNALGPGQVLVLENLRFHPEEEENEAGFALKLARLGDVYVNDAFGAAHRAHASTVGMVRHFRDRAAGFLLEREVTVLSDLLGAPAAPFVAVLGGAKVSDKLGVLQSLLGRVQALCIGGAMAYTFLRAQGKPVGRSRVELDRVSLARETLREAEERGVRVALPTDHLAAERPQADAPSRVVAADAFPENLLGVDIGPATAHAFRHEIEPAGTVFWNGPMGIAEWESFAGGTKAVAQALTEAQGLTVVGGGDSAAAVRDLGFRDDQFGHISTGGGASLEYLEGKTLPGLAVLEEGA